MYYVHCHSNHGHLYIQLPGLADWSCWNIEYAMDALFEIKDSTAQQLTIDDLPEGITATFDFSRLREHIKYVYKITP